MCPPAARISDMHVCPMATPGTPPVPHVGGPISGPCAATVLTGGLLQARVGDMAVCVGPPDTIIKGSPTVIVMGSMAARIGDSTAHGGTIVVGWPTVIIGDAGGGSAPPGGMSMVMAQLGVEKQGGDPGATAAAAIGASERGLPFHEICSTNR